MCVCGAIDNADSRRNLLVEVSQTSRAPAGNNLEIVEFPRSFIHHGDGRRTATIAFMTENERKGKF